MGQGRWGCWLLRVTPCRLLSVIGFHKPVCESMFIKRANAHRQGARYYRRDHLRLRLGRVIVESPARLATQSIRVHAPLLTGHRPKTRLVKISLIDRLRHR